MVFAAKAFRPKGLSRLAAKGASEARKEGQSVKTDSESQTVAIIFKVCPAVSVNPGRLHNTFRKFHTSSSTNF